MSPVDVLGALRRHLLVLVVLLAATGAAGWAVWVSVATSYESSASMVVLTPNTAQGPNGKPLLINPYQNIGVQAAQVAASAIARVASSEEFVDQLARQGVTSDTTVEVAVAYGGGVVLSLVADNPVAESARADLAVVSTQIGRELRDRQLIAGAPRNTLLTATDLTAATVPVQLTSSRAKLVGVVLVIGVLVAMVAVVALERLRRSRDPAERRADEAGPGAGGRADEGDQAFDRPPVTTTSARS